MSDEGKDEFYCHECDNVFYTTLKRWQEHLRRVHGWTPGQSGIG